jgi:HEAT repeat protein
VADLRRNAATALVQLGPDAAEAVPILAKYLPFAKDASTRRFVLEVLGAVGPGARTSVPQVIEQLADEELHGHAVETLARIGKGAVPELLRNLNDRNLKVRLGVIESLGAIGPEARAAVIPLSGGINRDRHPEIRRAIGDALRKIQR